MRAGQAPAIDRPSLCRMPTTEQHQAIITYISHGHHLSGEVPMNGSRLAPLRRVLAMVSMWLVIGAMIALLDGLDSGAGFPIVRVMNGGLAALAIAGAVLGLIGGDAIGSGAGAAVAFLGCWAAHYFRSFPVEPDVRYEVVIVGAVFGAIGFSAFFRPIVGDVVGSVSARTHRAPVPSCIPPSLRLGRQAI